MTTCETECESLIINLLQREPSLRLDQIVSRLPELTWNQVFQTIDGLSRMGGIEVRRQGFEYEVRSRGWQPHKSHRSQGTEAICN